MVQRLLVPVDGSELSARAIEESIRLAQQLGVGITGFVAEPQLVASLSISTLQEHRKIAVSVHKTRTAEHAQGVLGRFEAQARKAGIDFDGHFTHVGDVDEAIVQAAEQHGCDMIVMATHERGVIEGLLSHSHTKGVIARSRVPVVVVH
jgi:nucleotide-binding universal stress UspA family protein